MARVFVAMSGGVDSSTAAALLVDAGHDVTGVTMRLLEGDGPDGCCSLDGARSAKRVCDHIGIPHYTLAFTEPFRRGVIDPFVTSYAAGRTPNPCVECNDRVKFSELMRRAMLHGAEYLATGHYARVIEADGQAWLGRGVDTAKDQSYFLYRMTEEQLRRTMFPIGHLTKVEVRELARDFGLPTAERRESQETCFVADGNVRAFVRDRAPEAFVAGDVVDAAGRVVGAHDGVPGLTVGQRRGLSLGAPERLYVTSTDAASATVCVDTRPATARVIVASDPVWRVAESATDVTARVRYRGDEVAGVASLRDGRLTVRLSRDVDAPAPGQALVCYQGERVVGGGVMEEAT